MARRRQNVISLRGAALPIIAVNRDVVSYLEARLAEARDGQIAGVALATVHPQGHSSTGWAGNADTHSMIAAVARLNHRLLRETE